MIIYTANLTIRKFKAGDEEEFYSLAHEEAVKEYVRYAYCKNLAQAKESVDDYIQGNCRDDFYLAVEKEGKMVGCIIAIRIKKTILDVSVLMGEKFRGQGIMKEAMKGFIEWLKENTKYCNLSIAIKQTNKSSLRLASKIGAEAYGIANDTYFLRIPLR